MMITCKIVWIRLLNYGKKKPSFLRAEERERVGGDSN